MDSLRNHDVNKYLNLSQTGNGVFYDLITNYNVNYI